MTYFAPPITPEQLHEQDERRRGWDEQEIGVTRHLPGYDSVEGGWYAATNPPEVARDEREQTMGALWGERLLL